MTGKDWSVDAEDIEDVAGLLLGRDLRADLGSGNQELMDDRVEYEPRLHRVGGQEDVVAVQKQLGDIVVEYGGASASEANGLSTRLQRRSG